MKEISKLVDQSGKFIAYHCHGDCIDYILVLLLERPSDEVEGIKLPGSVTLKQKHYGDDTIMLTRGNKITPRIIALFKDFGTTSGTKVNTR